MSDPRRPPHLTAHNAATFQLQGVVDAYHLRAPHSPALAPMLAGLMAPAGAAILELGCGTGEIARMLAPHAARIDAVDISPPMLERARAMSDARYPNIRWIEGAAEDVKVSPPYALAVAGDALHWMDWDIVLPRLRDALAPGAVLAIVSVVTEPPPWSEGLQQIVPHYSAMQDFVRFDLVDELVQRRLFAVTAEATGLEPFERTVDEYIAALHATAGLARERMGEESALAFDADVRSIVAPFVEAGVLRLMASARVVWGVPGPVT